MHPVGGGGILDLAGREQHPPPCGHQRCPQNCARIWQMPMQLQKHPTVHVSRHRVLAQQSGSLPLPAPCTGVPVVHLRSGAQRTSGKSELCHCHQTQWDVAQEAWALFLPKRNGRNVNSTEATDIKQNNNTLGLMFEGMGMTSVYSAQGSP